jgi:hypothetical protein
MGLFTVDYAPSKAMESSEFVCTSAYINQESEDYFMDKAISRIEESARRIEKMELRVRMYFAFAFFSGLAIGLLQGEL